MAEKTKEQRPDEARPAESAEAQLDEPLPVPADPTRPDAKGYSADPRPETAAGDKEPVPLVPSPDGPSAVRVPERDNHISPTGREEAGH